MIWAGVWSCGYDNDLKANYVQSLLGLVSIL